MATEEERREFAKSLRHVAGVPPEWGTSACCIAECLDEDDYPMWESSGPLFSKLADLIEPDDRTCRPVEKWSENSAWPYLACSQCGEPLKYREMSKDEYELCPYCAGCGAKVEED